MKIKLTTTLLNPLERIREFVSHRFHQKTPYIPLPFSPRELLSHLPPPLFQESGSHRLQSVLSEQVQPCDIYDTTIVVVIYFYIQHKLQEREPLFTAVVLTRAIPACFPGLSATGWDLYRFRELRVEVRVAFLGEGVLSDRVECLLHVYCFFG